MVKHTDIIRDLGDGLVLRSAVPDDMEALVEFNSLIHSYDGSGDPETHVGAWVRDLFTATHPTFEVPNFLVVEHVPTQRIVSSCNLIPQTWAYEDIEFGVGRPELVGTHPDFRRRGLITAQFEVLHQWSAERGHLLQAITGIPYYYRQFGYQMTVDYHGGRKVPLNKIPEIKDGDEEAYTIRPATTTDIPFIIQLDEARQSRNLLRCMRGQKEWQYLLCDVSNDSMDAVNLWIVDDHEKQPIGFLAHPKLRWHEGIFIKRLELVQGTPWQAVMPAVLRHMAAIGSNIPHYDGEEKGKQFEAVFLHMGTEHPSYEICEHMITDKLGAYAYFIRVPDMTAFLKHITPVLERRLANSLLAGYSGNLILNFYRGGIELSFENGSIKAIEPWPGYQPTKGNSAEFPDMTFYHVLFGYRTVDEIKHIFPDSGARGTTKLLISSLFPKCTSHIWPIS